MFEDLTERLGGVFRNLLGRGRLSEQDVKDSLREIRRVLLEADVNLNVARDFLKSVEARAVGADLLQSVQPGQQVIKVVHEELVKLLGGAGPAGGLQFPSNRAAVLLLAGLQGSGKTTTAAKLARFWMKKEKRVLLAALDLQRPAAVDQLEVLGSRSGRRCTWTAAPR